MDLGFILATDEGGEREGLDLQLGYWTWEIFGVG